MTNSLDMYRQVNVTFDLATLSLLHQVIGFAGFHDPFLDHLGERQQQVLWAGDKMLLDALRAAGVEDWDAAEAAAEQIWDLRHTPD